MTYIFSGLLSSEEPTTELADDNEELVFRLIEHPDVKAGILFPTQTEEQVDSPNQKTIQLIEEAGLHGISNGVWIYYMCWGGSLEVVALAKVNNSKVDKETYQIHEDIEYTDLFKIFSAFGITIENSGHFEPFVRDYWGEHGY